MSEIKECRCMEPGLSLSGKRKDQSQKKNEMKLLNTFIELWTITKHNEWSLKNKKQQMDQFWSWQILLQICDGGKEFHFLIVCGDKYIQCVSLRCLSFLLFKLLSKQKNHNLEISILGQLCPGSLVISTLEGPEGPLWDYLMQRTKSACCCQGDSGFSSLFWKNFCMYKGWKVSLNKFTSSWKRYQNCNQIKWLFSSKTSEEWASFWNLTAHLGGCVHLSLCICLCACMFACVCACVRVLVYLCMCAWVSVYKICAPLPWFCRLFMKKGPIQRVKDIWGREGERRRGTF